MCTPFRGKQFTFIQPDGSELTVRGWGNQHHAVFETLSGYTVVRDPTSGYYMYADLDDNQDELIPTAARPRLAAPQQFNLQQGLRISREAARNSAAEKSGLSLGGARWQERRRQERMLQLGASGAGGILPAPPKRTTTGKFVGLCLLIEFPDVPGTIPQAEVDAFCNQPGYSNFHNNGSVRDYFLDVSGGKLDYSNVVQPYYQARHPRQYYTDNAIEQPRRARELIKEALAYWKAQGFDFSQLTADTDGYVYAVNVFYAGKCINNWGEGLWPHAHYLKSKLALGANRFAYDYQITDIGTELSLGTFCHENGHMICDFPDLYDYGDESAGVGAFCLMCAGANVDEKNPTDINPYLKFRAGWAISMALLQPGGNYTAVAGSNKFFLHRKNAHEYFVVESRVRAKRDSALPAEGLAVWHVDELGDNQYEQRHKDYHYECSLIQADGQYHLEADRTNIGDPGDLFGTNGYVQFGPASRPASTWWDGTSSGLDIAGIAFESGSATFKCL